MRRVPSFHLLVCLLSFLLNHKFWNEQADDDVNSDRSCTNPQYYGNQACGSGDYCFCYPSVPDSSKGVCGEFHGCYSLYNNGCKSDADCPKGAYACVSNYLVNSCAGPACVYTGSCMGSGSKRDLLAGGMGISMVEMMETTNMTVVEG